MKQIYIKQISPLEKVLINRKGREPEVFSEFSALQGEKISYQIMYYAQTDQFSVGTEAHVTVESPILDSVTLYRVGNVPSEMPCHPNDHDDDYITTEAGLLPDVLFPLESNVVFIAMRPHCLWVDIKVPEDLLPGDYPVTVKFSWDDGAQCVTFLLKVIGAKLPAQKTIYTQWIHTDCITDYFNVPVFSDKYWKIVENYLKTAVDCGINMILTPVFTPPLDTEVGKERKTVQLVDVYRNNGSYSFHFEKFEKWVRLAQACGIEYFEISHLLTQWGAEFTPKIMAEVDGEYKRIFGWDVRAVSKEYEEFLDCFLPALVAEIDRLGIRDKTYFHLSDEPYEQHLDSYLAGKKMLTKHLKGFVIMDALSNVKFYEEGIVEHPVAANYHVQDFIDHGVKDLWTYTCCGPRTVYSNRFMAMPSGRNRVIGAQMYRDNIVGFLHWGMNFYYTQLSKRQIDPYQVTDAGGAFPSGDAFSLYPYKDGAIQSIRSRVFFDALQDIRAFACLESFVGKDKVNELISEYGIHSFADYSHDYQNLLRLRMCVNEMIQKYAEG